MPDPHAVPPPPPPDNPWELTAGDVLPTAVTVRIDDRGLHHTHNCRDCDAVHLPRTVTGRTWATAAASCCAHQMGSKPASTDVYDAVRDAVSIVELAEQLATAPTSEQTPPAEGPDGKLQTRRDICDPAIGWQIRALIHTDRGTDATLDPDGRVTAGSTLHGPAADLYRQLGAVPTTLAELHRHGWPSETTDHIIRDLLERLRPAIRRYATHGGVRLAARQMAAQAADTNTAAHLSGFLHAHLTRLPIDQQIPTNSNEIRAAALDVLADLTAGLQPHGTTAHAPDHVRAAFEPAILSAFDLLHVYPYVHDTHDQLIAHVSAAGNTAAAMWASDLVDIDIPAQRTRLQLAPPLMTRWLTATRTGITLGTAPKWLTHLEPADADELLTVASNVHGPLPRTGTGNGPVSGNLLDAITAAAHTLDVPTGTS